MRYKGDSERKESETREKRERKARETRNKRETKWREKGERPSKWFHSLRPSYTSSLRPHTLVA